MLQGPVSDETLSGELFLLSCRAMGKGVERVMLKTLAERALAAGVKTLSIAFTETDRNEPVRRFFEGLGGFTLDAATIAELSPVPEETEAPRGPASCPSATGGTAVPRAFSMPPSPDASPPNCAIRRRCKPCSPRRNVRVRDRPAFVKPGTKTQTRLAEIWRGILGLEDVGLDDPFSALGGSSIQLVRLHAALRREFGTALELVELFELPTIAAQPRSSTRNARPPRFPSPRWSIRAAPTTTRSP